MKDYLTIGELAKLRNVSTRTLRYYDDIGLLKPDYIDSENGRRYYSITAVARLGLVRELKQLDMSLEEIMDFVNIIDPEKSYELLLTKEKELRARIKELEALKKTVSKRKRSLRASFDSQSNSRFIRKKFPDRYFLCLDKTPIKTEEEVWKGSSEIEKRLLQKRPEALQIFATSAYTGLVPRNRLFDEEIPAILMFQLDEPLSQCKDSIVKVPAGEFLCFLVNTEFWDNEESIHALVQYALANEYQITGDLLYVIQVDDSVVSDRSMISWEFQLPIMP